MLSVAIDHYVRVFVRVFRAPKAALAAAQNSVSYVLQSESCPSFFLRPVLPKQSVRRTKSPALHAPRITLSASRVASTQAPTGAGEEDRGRDETTATHAPSTPRGLGGTCPETGGTLKAGGPIWSGPLHDEAWLTRAIALASAAETKLENADGDDGRYCATENSNLSSEVKDVNLLAQVRLRRPRLAAGARVDSLLRAVCRELPDVPLFYNLRDVFATLGLARHPQREQVLRCACLTPPGWQRCIGMENLRSCAVIFAPVYNIRLSC